MPEGLQPGLEVIGLDVDQADIDEVYKVYDSFRGKGMDRANAKVAAAEKLSKQFEKDQVFMIIDKISQGEFQPTIEKMAA